MQLISILPLHRQRAHFCAASSSALSALQHRWLQGPQWQGCLIVHPHLCRHGTCMCQHRQRSCPALHPIQAWRASHARGPQLSTGPAPRTAAVGALRSSTLCSVLSLRELLSATARCEQVRLSAQPTCQAAHPDSQVWLTTCPSCPLPAGEALTQYLLVCLQNWGQGACHKKLWPGHIGAPGRGRQSVRCALT